MTYPQKSGYYTEHALVKKSYDFGAEAWTSTNYAVRFDIFGHGYTRLVDYLPVETSSHVLDTDYLQYAIVYGCDTWLWGLFHT